MSVADVLGLGYGGAALFIASLIVIVISRRRRTLKLPYVVLVFAVLAIGAFTYWTGAAVYLRFAASRAQLDEFVIVARRQTLNDREPRTIGLFKVRETETLQDGTVRLITSACMFDDCGLAFSSRGRPPVIGEDSYDHLTGGWWQWWRSW